MLYFLVLVLDFTETIVTGQQNETHPPQLHIPKLTKPGNST